MRIHWAVAVTSFIASLVAGCGSSESESSFTSCEQTESACTAGTCVLEVECEVDECESEVEYHFNGEDFESKCTFGDTRTRTTFPLDGGSGRREIRRNVEECFYEAEFDGDDFDEEGTCTRVRDCTIETLACDASSEPGDPDCDVRESAPCPEPVGMSPGA